jgi:hypothetical protein
VVRTDCRGLRKCLCVIVIFNCEAVSVEKSEYRGFRICFCVIVIFIIEGSVRCEDRLQGN